MPPDPRRQHTRFFSVHENYFGWLFGEVIGILRLILTVAVGEVYEGVTMHADQLL